jgi:hypothetical protein
MIDFTSLNSKSKTNIYLFIYLKFIIMKTIVLESAKGVKGGKVQLAFSQVIETGKAPSSILGLLNASDERFNQSKPRMAWLTAQPEDVKKVFNLDLNLAEGEELEINMVDPRMAGDNRALNIQITETTEGTEYDVANFETRAKRAGKDGDFIMKDGKYIYVRTTVVAGEAKHLIFDETTRVSANPTTSSLISDALGE